MAVPFTTIAGERVFLRPFRVEDAADIAESCQDPEIPRFTMMPEAMSEAQARVWMEQRLARVHLVTHVDNPASQRVAVIDGTCGSTR